MLASAKDNVPAPCKIVRRDSFICSSPAKPPLCTAYSVLNTGQRRTFAGITEFAGITRTPSASPLEGDMTEQPNRQKIAADGIAAPLRYTVFRRIWLASLLSN